MGVRMTAMRKEATAGSFGFAQDDKLILAHLAERVCFRKRNCKRKSNYYCKATAKANAGVLRCAQNDKGSCVGLGKQPAKVREYISKKRCARLFHGKLGVVAVTGDDGVLLRFAFFVLHA